MLVGRVLADVGHLCRALVLSLLAVGVLATPLAANGAAKERALVPATLLAQADANPEQVFAVIVQGRGRVRTGDVALDVAREREASPGKGKGIKRRFATISGVAAELTGKQILKLAGRGDILTITVDAPVAAGGGMLPPSVLGPPAIGGVAKEGELLTATDGVWSGSEPIEYSRRWQRCDALGSVCVDIEGSTGAVYTAVAADVGSTLRLTVTATNAVGSATGISEPTAVVQAASVGPLPPVNLALPAISGEATEGQTLTASEGTWGGSFPVVYAYAWQRCDATGAGCVDAAGATGISYVLTSSDVGSTLRVVVTATDSGGSTSATSLPSGVVTSAPLPPATLEPAPSPVVVPPMNVSSPAVSGDARDGATLTATPGMWDGAGTIAQTYAWERCGGGYAQAVLADQPTGYWRLDDGTAVDASGNGNAGVVSGTVSTVDGAAADSAALELGAAAGIEVANVDVGPAFTLETWVRIDYPQQDKGLLGRWRYDEGGGALLWIDTEGHYSIAIGREPANYLTTTVAPHPGRWEHVVGTWDGSDLRLFVNGVEAGSKPFVGDHGSTLRAFEIGKYGDPTQYLEGTLDEAALYPRALGATDVLRHYNAGCHAIADATNASYSVGAADAGSQLRVRVTASNEAGSATAVSNATVQVAAAPPVSVAAPQVNGSAVVAQTLTASPGTWSGAQPIENTYRWQRCDTAGACVDIVGATGATYTLASEDVGSAVKVVVSATNSAGTGEAASSPTASVLSAKPAALTAPTVSGVPEDGGTLVAATGTWSDAEATRTVQWERCDANGASCAAIAGAAATSYVLREADVGGTVRAVVTATNAAGSAEAASAPSAVVADSFGALQQWPAVIGASVSWESAKANVAAPTIAIVDSGIDANRSDFGGRVIHEETLTTLTPNSPGDGRGHGTFVASVAAGEATDYAGVAPNANLVSLDVLDDSGRATTSDVIAAADWIYLNKAAYGIRVANFSLHGTTATSFRVDPLDRALEKLWFSGVVVVAAAGNYAVDGAASGVLFPPANDPFILTVGATDTAGTMGTDDDFTAPWSAWGHTPDGFAKPDISAPGRYIVGAVPPTSSLATERPGNVVAPGYMQLSGTSFAAPMASGAAAHLLAIHPEWTPDQVKGALMYRAATLPAATANSYGIGELNIGIAAATASPPNPNLQLNAFLIPDPNGGPEPVFNDTEWSNTVQSDGFWGTGFWGTGFWGTGFWGTYYWEPPPPTPEPTMPPDGMATSALNNAIGEWLPTGGYWLTPPR